VVTDSLRAKPTIQAWFVDVDFFNLGRRVPLH